MSINYCTLASSSVDSFCSPRRGLIFDNLVSILHPVTPALGGTNPRVLRDTYPVPPQFEFEDRPDLTFEQPIISVSAEIFGHAGTDTQDVSNVQLDFVTVTGFDVGPEIGVNITDLTFE